MSRTIDERIVSMQFDNKNFESNVNSTISMLDKLKEKLNLPGASKGLENVGRTAAKIDMDPMSQGVEAVRLKFSALEVMAVTALANITNSAVNAGKRIVSALTIDPIKTGLQEYETQMNAIQTIMANTSSKGTTLNQVNAALDELNTYADKTIYNFTEMTRNIGTFTAAGIELDTSVSAIKGIANLAAVSGSTSQQASTAMYQLSQALAAGYVKLQDWNSVVNAGMGGEVFQNALKDTARVHGIAVDDIIEKEGSFRESLKKGWITTDILTETLNKFTGDLSEAELKAMGYSDEQTKAILAMGNTANEAATKVKTLTQLFDTLKEATQSGWATTWRLIIGDFEEAKAMWTNVSYVLGDFIGKMSDSRNAVLELWKSWGGREVLLETFKNLFNAIASVVVPIKDAFRDIFPADTLELAASKLLNFTVKLKMFTKNLQLNDETSDKLRRTFKGLFAIFDIVREVIVSVVKAIKPLGGHVVDLASAILSVTASIGDFLVGLRDAIKVSGLISTVLNGIVSVVDKVVNAFKSLVEIVSTKFPLLSWESLSGFLGKIGERIEQITGLFTGMFKASSSSTNSMSLAMKKTLQNAGLTNAQIKTMESDFLSMNDTVKNSKIVQVLQGIWNVVKKLGGAIVDVFGKLASGIVDSIGSGEFKNWLDVVNTGVITGILLGINKFIKGFTDNIKEAGGIFDSINSALSSVKGVLDGVRSSLETWQQNLKSKTLMNIAISIGILAASLFVLSTIDSQKLTHAFAAMTGLFAELIGSLTLLSKFMSGTGNGLGKLVVPMIGISIAILILSAALKSLSSLNWEEIAKGLTGIVGLSTILAITAKSLSSSQGKLIKGAGGLILFAVAIKILASACVTLSALSWEEIAKGLVGVGVLMAEISIFLNTAKFSKGVVGTATGILILSAAIKILASAVKDFGSMDIGVVKQGLIAMGALLAELAIFTNFTGNAKHVVSTGVAMIAIAAAMKIFASAVADFGSMPFEQMKQGLIAMAAALVAVTIAVNLMPKNMITIGAGLVIVGASLHIISGALASMGAMPYDVIGRGLVAMGGSMTILAIALNLMKGTLGGSAALLVASVALAVITPVLMLLGNMSWESIAKGLVALAGAFAVIGIAAAVLAPLLPAILGLAGAMALIGASVALVGVGLLTAGAGLVMLAAGITALGASAVAGSAAVIASLTTILTGVLSLIPMLATKITLAIVTIVSSILTSIKILLPQFVSTVSMILTSILTLLKTYIPQVIELVGITLSELLTLISTYTPQIVDTVGTIILSIIQGLETYLPQIIESILNTIIAILEGIAEKLPEIIQAGVDVVVALIRGVGTTVPQLIDAGFKMIIDFINGLAEAIRTNTSLLMDAVRNLFNAIIEAAITIIFGSVTMFIEGGGAIITGLIDGIGALLSTVVETVSGIIDSVIDFISGAVDLFKTHGGKLITGLIDGVAGLTTDVTKAFSDIVSKAIDTITKFVTNFIDAGKNLVSGFIDGITGKKKEASAAAAELGSAASEATKKELDIHSPSRVMDRIGQQTGQGFVDGLGSKKDDAEKVAKETGQSVLEVTAANATEMLKQQEKANDASVKEDKDYWNEMLNAAKGYVTEDGKVQNEQVKNATSTNEKISQSDKAVLANQKATNTQKVADKKSTNAQVLAEEDAYWKKLMGIRKAAEEEEKKQKTDYETFQADILTKTVDLMNKYTDALKSNADSLMNRSGIFKAVAEQESVSSDTLMENLEAQRDQLYEFQEVLTQLNSRLEEGELKDAINQMGVDSLQELIALNDMTDSELQNYVDIFDEKYSLSNEIAALRMKTLKTDTESQLSELYGGVQVNLDQFAKSFDGTFDSIRSYVSESIQIGKDVASGVGEGITEGTETTKASATQMMTDTLDAAKEAAQIHSPSEVFKQEVGMNIAEGVAEGIEESTAPITAIEESLTAMLEVFATHTEEFTTAGSNMSAAYAEGFSGSGSVSLTDKCVEVINAAITGISSAITNSQPNLQALGSGIMTSFVTGITIKMVDVTTATNTCMTNIVNAILAANPNTTTAISTILMNILTSISSKYPDFMMYGSETMSHFLTGIQQKDPEIVAAYLDIVVKGLAEINNQYNDYYRGGVNLAEGFKRGILSKAREIVNAATSIAKKAIDAVNKTLKTKSPSREMIQRGEWFSEGFAIGIQNESDFVNDSASTMAEDALSSISKTINAIADVVDSDVDLQPTIRPVLDLSDVEKGAKRLNTLFSHSQAVSINTSMNEGVNANIQNGGGNAGNSYQFVQNNYSPKALSRIDIYRQTKNQFSAMERRATT